MSRKYVRGMIRAKAEKMGAKPSRYVHNYWNAMMIKKYGVQTRAVNVWRGALKRVPVCAKRRQPKVEES